MSELAERTALVIAIGDIDKAFTLAELKTALKVIISKLAENGQLPKSVEKWD